MSPRVRAFVAVGFMGFLVQTTVLALLTMVLHWEAVTATLIAVEAAVVTNFLWHERWTWRDRRDGTWFSRLVRFHVANGITSLAGNALVVALTTGWFGIHPMIANLAAVCLLATANFIAADKWVFARRVGIAASMVLVLTAGTAQAATLRADTVEAWDRHVAAFERSLTSAGAPPPAGELRGDSIGVPGGTIHDWRGSIRIPNTTVAQLVKALTDPGLPPPQDDVVESRVLEKHGLALRVYLKLVRSVIITATYETEHDVLFVCESPTLATSRSIATKIVEVGGDRGFLWRLNSYWRYRQVGADVEVDVVSLSLSRGVPTLLAPIANPIARRVARESLAKTLEAVKRFGQNMGPG